MQSNILKSKMALAGINQHDLAKLMADGGTSINVSTLNQKVNGRREFKQSEITSIARLLNLSPDETMDIFFGQDVS